MITLEEVLKIQSATYEQWRMFAFIVRKLKAMPDVTFYVNKGNIYVTKGTSNTYPCIVSHMDTVHDIVEDLQILHYGSRLTGFNPIRMKQTGIGGDDKVGVYITLKAIERNEVIKAAFFRDEECGCFGSSEADMDFFLDCGYVLQCDRSGNNDFVTTACGARLSGKDFWNAIKDTTRAYGYQKCDRGGMTDVYQLKISGLNIAVANMSCGYYRPHMPDEYVDITDVRRCENMVMAIINKLGSRKFHHHAPVMQSYYPKGKHTPGGPGKNALRDFNDFDFLERDDKKYNFGKPSGGEEQCECCLEAARPGELRFETDYNLWVCNTCYSWVENERKRSA